MFCVDFVACCEIAPDVIQVNKLCSLGAQNTFARLNAKLNTARHGRSVHARYQWSHSLNLVQIDHFKMEYLQDKRDTIRGGNVHYLSRVSVESCALFNTYI